MRASPEGGSELTIRSDGNRLILKPRAEVLSRLRARFARAEVSLAAELSEDRSRAAADVSGG